MENILLIAIIIIAAIFWRTHTPMKTLNIENQYVNSDNAKELFFDVRMYNDEDPFELTSYQVAIDLLGDPLTGVSFEYVDGSSDLNNVPQVGIEVSQVNNMPHVTFVSGPSPTQTLSANTSYLVGKFKLTTQEDMANVPNLIFLVNDSLGTIITGPGFQNDTTLFDFINTSDLGINNTSVLYLKNTEKYRVDANPITKEGYEGAIDGDLLWDIDNPSLVNITVSQDTMSCIVEPTGATGSANLMVSGDIDVGPNVVRIYNSIDVYVSAGQTYEIEVDFTKLSS